jgi:hypothetical protein
MVDADIPDDVRVFRCVREDEVVLDEVSDRSRPKSSAFADHPEDGAMSVYLENLIVAADRNLRIYWLCGQDIGFAT